VASLFLYKNRHEETGIACLQGQAIPALANSIAVLKVIVAVVVKQKNTTRQFCTVSQAMI
jgi:hypothetical protein